MSNDILRAIRDLQATKTEKSLLRNFADRADAEGRCFPSVPRISRDTCLGETAVIEGIKALEGDGLLHVERAPGRVNQYSVDLGRVRAMVASATPTSAELTRRQSLEAPNKFVGLPGDQRLWRLLIAWLRPTESELAEWGRAAQAYGEYPPEVLQRALLLMIVRRDKRFPDPAKMSRWRLALASDTLVLTAAAKAPPGAPKVLLTLA